MGLGKLFGKKDEAKAEDEAESPRPDRRDAESAPT